MSNTAQALKPLPNLVARNGFITKPDHSGLLAEAQALGNPESFSSLRLTHRWFEERGPSGPHRGSDSLQRGELSSNVSPHDTTRRNLRHSFKS